MKKGEKGLINAFFWVRGGGRTEKKGGGMAGWGKKMKMKSQGKKGKEKGRKITLKKGKKALKMHLIGI